MIWRLDLQPCDKTNRVSMIGIGKWDKKFQTQGGASDYCASMGWSCEGEGQNIGCV
jgi:hypothetical protein